MIENEAQPKLVDEDIWLCSTGAGRQSPVAGDFIFFCSSTSNRFVLMNRRDRACFMICNRERSKSSSSFLSSSFQRGRSRGVRDVYILQR